MPPTRLDHIAIALPSIGQARDVLVGVLGGVPDQGRPAGVFRWATWRFEGGGCIEILEPGAPRASSTGSSPRTGPASITSPSRSPGCPMSAAGYDIVGRDESDASWKEAFLHPKQAQGIVVQLVETASAPGPDPALAIPPGLADPPSPVRILGLRLRAHSATRALTQWRDLLDGRVEAPEAGGIVFRWPDSPMWLAVDVDPTGVEGPIALELASDRTVAGLDDAGARLGIRLAQRSA